MIEWTLVIVMIVYMDWEMANYGDKGQPYGTLILLVTTSIGLILIIVG